MSDLTLRKLSGYTWTPRNLESVDFTSHFIAVEEEIEEEVNGIFIPRQNSVIWGRVLRSGSEAEARGINVGDRVLYERWMGGKWEFDGGNSESKRCLIMDVDHIIARVE